jgi:hypothetical protein
MHIQSRISPALLYWQVTKLHPHKTHHLKPWRLSQSIKAPPSAPKPTPRASTTKPSMAEPPKPDKQAPKACAAPCENRRTASTALQRYRRRPKRWILLDCTYKYTIRVAHETLGYGMNDLQRCDWTNATCRAEFSARLARVLYARGSLGA